MKNFARRILSLLRRMVIVETVVTLRLVTDVWQRIRNATGSLSTSGIRGVLTSAPASSDDQESGPLALFSKS